MGRLERVIRALFWVLLVCLVVLPFIVFLAQIGVVPNEICPKGRQANQEDCPAYHPALVILWHVGEGLNHYGPALAAVAGIAVAAFTWLLWWSTNKLWEANRIALEISQAAYLSTNRPRIRIKHVYFPEPLWGDQQIDVKLIVVNSGLTDAIVLAFNVEVRVLLAQKSLPPRPEFKDVRGIADNERRLAPGMTLALKKWPIPGKLSHTEFAQLKTGERVLWVYGFVEYVDLQHRIRKTAFCRTWEHPRGTGAGTELGRLQVFEDPDYEYQD